LIPTKEEILQFFPLPVAVVDYHYSRALLLKPIENTDFVTHRLFRV
jgi:hypothetical protein